ncbi:MAG: SMI1/KNR4 family protein [Bacteroidota bacterium]
MTPSARPLLDALDTYLRDLAAAGAVSPEVLEPAAAEHIAALEALEGVTVPASLRTFLSRVGSYDLGRCRALEAFEPDFANSMFVIAARTIPAHYTRSAGVLDPEYWPLGFVPFLWGGSGDFTVVNCDAASPDYGAVYDLDEAYGVEGGPMDADLTAFLLRSSRELADGRRVFTSPTVSALDLRRRP